MPPTNHPTHIRVRVPATTANLGPGFDCLALALDLFNEVDIRLQGGELLIEKSGLGRESLPKDRRNLVVRATLRLYEAVGAPFPAGIRFHCTNEIPMGSGMGSSAAAVLSGLLGANVLLGQPASPAEILHLAAGMEGHPDNVAAAQAGGLILVTQAEAEMIIRPISLSPDTLGWSVVVVTPVFNLPTRQARAALPLEVALKDAVYNIGRSTLVVEAFRSGDLDLLGRVMDDRLHQPYRLPLIPGAGAALGAARQAGAPAVALSGAGPSLVAFTNANQDAIAQAMVQAFATAGLAASSQILAISAQGASVTIVG